MPDLLTHVLFAYATLTILSLRWSWLDGEHVTIGMVGALIPDLSKAYLLIDEESIEVLLGLPFEWYGIHTVGGVATIAALVALWCEREVMGRVLAAGVIGGLTHLLLDSFIKEPTGYSYAALWPLTYHRIPSAGLYISTDIWPIIVAGAIALFAATWTRWQR